MNVRICLAMAALLGAASACDRAPPAQPPLAGAALGGPFALTDQNGRTVTDASFAGKYRIMYFGYTYCPDVCPTDMQAIGQAMRKLQAANPALAARIVPIFVSVDPARDTPAVMKPYVAAFGPELTGLTGTPAAIARVAKAYGVYYKAQPAAKGASGYLVDHSSQAILFDPVGKPIALIPTDQGPDAVAALFKAWVR